MVRYWSENNDLFGQKNNPGDSGNKRLNLFWTVNKFNSILLFLCLIPN